MERASVSAERRLMLVIGAVVFTDTMFYAAITPLLPTLAHSLHLSKLSAGVLTASYAIGTLVAAIPSGILAARIGPKRTVYVGLGLLAASTLAFGFVQNIALLDAARFVEGVGGACSWAGGLAWIVAEASPSRRGELIGGALGAAIAGALFGPVIGTIANAVGRGAAFSGVVVLALLLIWQAERLPLTHAPSGQGMRQLRSALRDRKLLVGVWLVTLPAMAGGAVSVLGPLRLHAFGAGAAAIGATYLVGAAAEAIVTPAVGRFSDRRGRIIPLRAGLVATIALLVCFTVPSTAFGLALLIVAVTTSVGAFWAPAMAMQSDAAESQHLDQALAAALMNLAWAVGVTVGEVGAGAIAKSAGDQLPMLLLAGVCGVTLAALVPRRSVQRIAGAVPDAAETEVG
jgi:predicted MFS family arabinose efflux permease